MKKFFVIAAALIVSVAAFAQETNKDENGKTKFGAYETNKFWDNWFITVGGGVNATWDLIGGAFELPGIAVEANVGKWFTPTVGVRAGYRGVGNVINGANDVFHFAKADFLWNFSNQVAGYKELRTWDVIPFAGFGALNTKAAGWEYALEAGIINNFRLGKRVDLNLELGGLLSPGQRYGNYGRFVTFPYATLGLGFNLGRVNWTRKATTVASYAAAVAAAEAAANAAKANMDAANAAKNAADAQAKALAAENQKLKDELANAQNQSADYNALFDEPIVAYFEIGKSKLSAKEKEHIKYVAKNIISRGDKVKFTLAGNADTKTGTKKRNQQLSQQRADYVYKIMTEELGLDGSLFTVKANGGNDIFDSPELNRAVIIEKQ